MSEPIEIEINRNQHYLALEAEATAFASLALNKSLTVKASAELGLNAGLLLEVKLAGLGIDIAMAAFSVAAECGSFTDLKPLFRMNGYNVSANAVLAGADVKSREIKAQLAIVEQYAARMGLGIFAARQAAVDVDNAEISLSI